MAAKRRGETPMMRQFHELKQQAGDALLLFRMGDFYELFERDAEVAAPALATMDGSLHALPSKPAPGLDDMDGSLYNLRAFG